MITKTPVYQPRLVNRGFEEATTGFEPVIRVLQTHALPLGHVAKNQTGRLCACRSFFGAGEEIRTLDLLLGKETFYR
jgi:hypothetical protein